MQAEVQVGFGMAASGLDFLRVCGFGMGCGTTPNASAALFLLGVVSRVFYPDPARVESSLVSAMQRNKIVRSPDVACG